MKLLHIVSLMICLSILVVVPVCAYETYQDDIEGSDAVLSFNYLASGAGANKAFSLIYIEHIELIDFPYSLVWFDAPGHVSTYGAGATNSNSTTFTGTMGGGVGTCAGTIGYQRRFNAVGTEIEGYQYIIFTQWDSGGLAGTQVITLNYDHVGFPLANVWMDTVGAWTTAPPTGFMMPYMSDGSNRVTLGPVTMNKQFRFINSYSVTKGLGLGIVGSIWKYSLDGPPTYGSTAFVINATDNQIVTSEAAFGTTTFNFDIPTESIYIALRDSEGDFHNTSTLFTVAPLIEGSYSIALSSSTLTLPGTIQGTIQGISTDLAKITDIDWSWADATGSYDFDEGGNTSRPLSYTKVSGTWWGYARGAGGIGGEYSRNKGTGMPNPVTLSNVSSSGYKIVTCFIGTSDGFWYTLTAGLTVAQGGMQTLIVEATDAYSNSLISYADITILDKSTNLWSNVTASGGVYNFLFPYNSNLYIEGTATGYGKTTKNWTVLPYPSYILKLPMYPTGTVAATNVSLNVVVLDGATSSIFPNVNVRLSDGQVRTTSGAGVAAFTVLASTSYQIVASKTGYTSSTRTLTTGVGGTTQDTYLTLNRIVVTTAPTLPPGVTAAPTVDTRTNAQKDLDMMNLIREYAPTLIMLSMMMTMMYLVGYKP